MNRGKISEEAAESELPTLLQSVPDVQAIRERLAAIQVEATALRSLLRLAERLRRSRGNLRSASVPAEVRA